MLVTVRWPGVRMAPISSISAWRQLRWKNSGAKQRITSAKRAGSRSMAAVLEWGRPSLTAHPLRCFRPGNGQTQEALVGFRGVGSASCDQGGDERTEQGFAATACVVHELEEPEIEPQLVLRETPVRTEPGAQEGPEPLDGVDVHFAEAIPVLVAGIFAAPVADHFVLIPPRRQGAPSVTTTRSTSATSSARLSAKLWTADHAGVLRAP